MKPNSCEKIQFELLQGSTCADHLKACEACRAFAEVVAIAAQPMPFEGEPPSAIDQTILASAASHHAPVAAPKKNRPLLLFVLAAAAALIIGFALWPSSTSEPAKLVENSVPGPEESFAMAADAELEQMLVEVADADYSGAHIDAELFAMELQLAAMSTETF